MNKHQQPDHYTNPNGPPKHPKRLQQLLHNTTKYINALDNTDLDRLLANLAKLGPYNPNNPTH